MWRDYKIFKMYCHYEGEELKEDNMVFIEEFSSRSVKGAYKYFKQNYNKLDEAPTYYILTKSDYSQLGRTGKRELYSDWSYRCLE